MADYDKKVKKILAQHGCHFARHSKGSHDLWFSPITNRPITVNHKIKSRDTANKILKDAGIPIKL